VVRKKMDDLDVENMGFGPVDAVSIRSPIEWETGDLDEENVGFEAKLTPSRYAPRS